MSQFNFGELLQQAKDAGAVTSTPDDGDYTLRVVGANAGDTKKGYPRFGIQWEIEGGPASGNRFWTNISFSDNPTNVAISFRQFREMGMGEDYFASNPDKEAVKERILQVGRITATVKTKKSSNGYENTDLSKIRLLGAGDPSVPSLSAVPSPAPAAPAPAAAPVQGITF